MSIFLTTPISRARFSSASFSALFFFSLERFSLVIFMASPYADASAPPLSLISSSPLALVIFPLICTFLQYSKSYLFFRFLAGLFSFGLLSSACDSSGRNRNSDQFKGLDWMHPRDSHGLLVDLQLDATIWCQAVIKRTVLVDRLPCYAALFLLCSNDHVLICPWSHDHQFNIMETNFGDIPSIE